MRSPFPGINPYLENKVGAIASPLTFESSLLYVALQAEVGAWNPRFA